MRIWMIHGCFQLTSQAESTQKLTFSVRGEEVQPPIKCPFQAFHRSSGRLPFHALHIVHVICHVW